MCKLCLCERCETEVHLLTGRSAASPTLHLGRSAERDKKDRLPRVSVSHVGGTDTFTGGPSIQNKFYFTSATVQISAGFQKSHLFIFSSIFTQKTIQ